MKRLPAVAPHRVPYEAERLRLSDLAERWGRAVEGGQAAARRPTTGPWRERHARLQVRERCLAELSALLAGANADLRAGAADLAERWTGISEILKSDLTFAELGARRAVREELAAEVRAAIAD